MDFLYDIFSFRLWIVTDLLRYLFLFLDGIIYNLVQPLYSASLELADIRGVLQQEETVKLISEKLYIFLGVFMVFKLAFSIISMIANPDLAADKQKGLGKVFTHAIITLVLVVVMPSIFRMAYNLQDLFINEGYLRGIFGETAGGRVANGNEGAELSKNVFSVFIKATNEEDGNAVSTVNEFKTTHSDGVNIPELNKDDVMLGHKNGRYNVAYMMLISTIVGGMLVFSFVKIGMEIAVRSLKLFVLEIISPIAVISYIDPTSASKGIFAKWMALTIKIYLSLFIRLSILFLFTSLLSGINVENFGGELGWLASILLILAILAFMQTAPKLLEEVFGYKPSDDSKAISGIAKGALGVGAAAVGSAGAYAMMKHDQKKLEEDPSWQPGRLRKFTSGVKNFASDVKSGAQAGYKQGSSGSGKMLPDNLNYKQAQKQHQKQLDELQTKHKEADKTRELGAEELSKYENLATTYSSNPARYSPAETAMHTSLSGDPNRQALYKENIGKKHANNETFSVPIANKKNTIIDTEFNLAKLSEDKTFAQSELNRIVSSGDKLVTDSVTGITVRFDESTQYLTQYNNAITRVTDVDAKIAGESEILEKTKGALESQLKDPLYARDAKLDIAIKTGKANKI